ncbi:frataxin family protein [Abortiporus biennis]
MFTKQTSRLLRRSAQSCRCSLTHVNSLVQLPRVVVSRSTTYQRPQFRTYATPPPHVKHSDLPVELYHRYSDATMENLLERLEDLIDEIENTQYEVEYSSGVLTLKLGDKGTYVINKQPPNKQIWLSSPISGPQRYDYEEEQDNWIYEREHVVLGDLLNKELSSALGQEVDLGLNQVSKLS